MVRQDGHGSSTGLASGIYIYTRTRLFQGPLPKSSATKENKGLESPVSQVNDANVALATTGHTTGDGPRVNHGSYPSCIYVLPGPNIMDM